MENKKIAVLQIDSVLGDQQANLRKIDDMIAAINDPSVRMAVFCEYGLSGYCTDLTKIAEAIPGSITDSLCEISKKHNIWITGGLPEKVSGEIITLTLAIFSSETFQRQCNDLSKGRISGNLPKNPSIWC